MDIVIHIAVSTMVSLFFFGMLCIRRRFKAILTLESSRAVYREELEIVTFFVPIECL